MTLKAITVTPSLKYVAGTAQAGTFKVYLMENVLVISLGLE